LYPIKNLSMQKSLLSVYFLGLSFLFSGSSFAQSATIQSEASYRSVDMLNSSVVWVSGSKGSILKTSDGGKSWQNKCPARYATHDFRGVVVLDMNTVVAISAGEAEKGQALVIRTNNEGETWQVVFESKEKGVFLDAIRFSNSKRGFILGDPIHNKPYLLQTTDGGQTWQRLRSEIPTILPGEASFAASNSCLFTEQKKIWFCTQSRLFHSTDYGKTWRVFSTPFESGSTKGIFGLYFSHGQGIAVGGDYKDSTTAHLQQVFTENDGKTWQNLEMAYGPGLTEGAFVTQNQTLVLCGHQGVRITKNKGTSFEILSKTLFHAIDCHENRCFTVGAKGKIESWDL
jgi:photosystem II stability/assembly factor-like uncharacterized protein